MARKVTRKVCINILDYKHINYETVGKVIDMIATDNELKNKGEVCITIDKKQLYHCSYKIARNNIDVTLDYVRDIDLKKDKDVVIRYYDNHDS